jgi:hypothetical protein
MAANGGVLEVRTHPFESRFLTLNAPRLEPGYPLQVLGREPSYQLAGTRFTTEEDLLPIFAISGQYALANTTNKNEVITSFGKYATRVYDREFVAENMTHALKLTAAVTPPVYPEKLTPCETIGIAKGTKAAGYQCLGTKGKFHSHYLTEMQDALANPSSLMECVPIYVLISKDEVRLKTKDCRDLGFPPVWFSDLVTMYEKDFFLTTLEAFDQSPIKLGVPMPQGWPKIVRNLQRHRSRLFTTKYYKWDAKQYDRSHPIELTLSWHELMLLKKCMFLVLDNDIAAYIAFWSCCRIFLLPDGRLVLVIAGIYSGDISTSNKNSYFHLVRMALCWIRIFDTIDGFRTFVTRSGLCLFGDDAICAAHYEEAARFLDEMPTVWEQLFGAELLMDSSIDISGVSFLGKRSLGNEPWSSIIPVSSDLDRQLSSLVLKGKRSMTPVQRLSKLVAHRMLLCGYSLPAGAVSEEVKSQNELGLSSLRKLDEYITGYIAKYDTLLSQNIDWSAQQYLATIPPDQLFSLQMTGRDVLFPEAAKLWADLFN